MGRQHLLRETVEVVPATLHEPSAHHLHRLRGAEQILRPGRVAAHARGRLNGLRQLLRPQRRHVKAPMRPLRAARRQRTLELVHGEPVVGLQLRGLQFSGGVFCQLLDAAFLENIPHPVPVALRQSPAQPANGHRRGEELRRLVRHTALLLGVCDRRVELRGHHRAEMHRSHRARRGTRRERTLELGHDLFVGQLRLHGGDLRQHPCHLLRQHDAAQVLRLRIRVRRPRHAPVVRKLCEDLVHDVPVVRPERAAEAVDFVARRDEVL